VGVVGAAAARRGAELAQALGVVGCSIALFDGQRRRAPQARIARALSSRPQVLFLDEPTVGLDRGSVGAARGDRRSRAREG
jgi:ABC-type uncharacterized transport system ATPase subunit